MGRRSSIKTKSKSVPVRKSPSELKPQVINQQPSGMGSIGQGMSLGAGAAIGSSMVHGAMGAFSSTTEKQTHPCEDVMKQFQECSKMNTDLNVCKPFLEFYSHCITQNNQ